MNQSTILHSASPEDLINQIIQAFRQEIEQLKQNFKLIHVTDDLSVSKGTSDYFTSLSHLIAPNFVKTSYDEGIVFKEKISNQPLYLTIYGKEYQIKPAKYLFSRQENFILETYIVSDL